MGTPAKATVSITVEKDEDFDKIFDWINKANAKKLNGKFKGDYNFGDVDFSGSYIDCEVYSDRSQNLYWQLEMFSDFCRTLDGVKEFSTSVWVMSDGPYWNRDDE